MTGTVTTACAPSTREVASKPLSSSRLLRPLEVRRIVSSPFTRCVETVEPLADALGLSVELDGRLAEGAGQAAYVLVQEDGIVCCTHGDVVGDLVGRGLKEGAAVVLRAGEVVREI